MANRFTGKTPLAGLRPILLDGRPVQDQFATYRDLLARQAGPAAAELFAEPIATWREPGDESGSISWYADATGEPEPLAALPVDRRAPLEQRLRETLAALQPAMADPRLGPWLRRALVLASPAGALAVGNAVVLTQWGLSRGEPANDAELASLAAASLGGYLPAMAAAAPQAAATPLPPPLPPPLPAQAPRPTGASPGAQAASPATANPPPPRPPGARPVGGGPGGDDGSAWNWWLLPAGALVALVFLALGLWQGSRVVAARFNGRPSTVDVLDEPATRAAIDRQTEQNAALTREIEARRRLLAGDVCQLDPNQAPRIGPDRAAIVPPASVPPPPGTPPFNGNLADLLKQAVVLVIAAGEGGVESGSGFFITPDLIVTNRHVIKDANPDKIAVTSEKLGKLTKVELAFTTPSSEIGGLDIAVLRIRTETQIQPLVMTPTVATLDQVIAAGYPGLLMRSDAALQKLIQGDVSAIPQVILTDGRINAIQPSPSGIKVMPHSAAVSGGNSGGPLVDGCGRVVGINTFITFDRDQVAHANYAQKSDEVIAFLREHGAGVTEVTGQCVPGAPGAPTPEASGPGPMPGTAAPRAAPGAAPAPGASPTPAATPPATR